MAKKKSAPPKGKETTASKSKTNKVTSSSKNSRTQAPKAVPSDRTASTLSRTEGRAFTYEEIGSAAGEVWLALTQNNNQTVAALKKSVQAPGDLVAAGIGWLAREEKLDFEQKGKTVRISLR